MCHICRLKHSLYQSNGVSGAQDPLAVGESTFTEMHLCTIFSSILLAALLACIGAVP